MNLVLGKPRLALTLNHHLHKFAYAETGKERAHPGNSMRHLRDLCAGVMDIWTTRQTERQTDGETDGRMDV